MSEPAAREKPDFIEKIADYAGWILAVSVGVIIAAWSLYFFQFRGSLSDDTAIWGQFGDFVGGTLNSVFAFFSFMILLSSLRLQLKELRLTREELEATRKELAASSEAQKMQAEHFEREAKKNDHINAIKFIISDMQFDTNKFNIEINELVAYQTYRSINPFDDKYPTKGDLMSYQTLRFEYYILNIESECRKIKLIDYHCNMLSSLYPDAPILYDNFRKLNEIVNRLQARGWITDLKFFGKHDFPIR